MREFCKKIGFLNENAEDISARAEDLEGICKILDDYDAIFGDYQLSARVSGLLRFLATQAPQEYKYHNFREAPPNEDAVQLMTVHKSKGLEFHTVFLPRLNRREFPVSKMGGKKYYHVLGGTFEENRAKYEADIEDERKLFYVAVTRAKQNLYLSYTLENQPVSEFISNAAESAELQIRRQDLIYQPPQKQNSYCKDCRLASDEQRQQWEEERAQQQAERDAYWDAVRYAREQLFDYYGTGNRFCPGIIMEYKDICKQGPDAILAKAHELGMI